MSMELMYTSAPQGIKPGMRGFCTVAMTDGIPAPLVERLELLSGYRPLFPPDDPNASRNPVVFAHWRLGIGRSNHNILSRVCFAGFDYTRRSNKFAHHLVLSAGELPAGGPAWLMLQPGMMEEVWSGEPRMIPAGRAIPRGGEQLDICSAWAAIAGDAGWGGVLVDAFLGDPSKPCSIIFEPGMDLLPLIDQAIRLLPLDRRWQVTFSTYFTEQPAGLNCLWRCCVAGTPAAKDAVRLSARTIDLTRPLGNPPAGPMVEAARTGIVGNTGVSIGCSMPADQRDLASADEEAPAPRAAASPFRVHKRLAGGEAQPYAVETQQNEADQSWMPPFDATVVERDEESSLPAAAGGTGRGGRGALFWVVAILWPIVVGACVLFVVRPTDAGGKDKQIASLQNDLKNRDGMLDKERQETKAATQLADENERQMKKAREEKEKANRDSEAIRGQSDAKDTRIKELEATTRRWETDIAALRTEQNKLKDEIKSPKAKPGTQAAVAKPLQQQHVKLDLSPPKATEVSLCLKWASPKGMKTTDDRPEPIDGVPDGKWTAVTVHLPAGMAAKWDVKRSDDNRKIEIVSKSGSRSVALEFKVEDGKLWRQIKSANDESLVPQIKYMAVICLHTNDGTRKAFQFGQPEPKHWPLADPLPLKDLYLAAGEAVATALQAEGTTVVLHGRPSEQMAWSISGDGASCLTLTSTNVENLKVKVLVDGGAIKTDAGEQLTHFAKERTDRAAALRRSISLELRQWQQDKRAYDAATDRDPAKQQLLADMQAAEKRAKGSQEELTTIEKRTHPLAIKEQAIEELKNKALEIRLVLAENGATIALVTTKVLSSK